MFLKNGIGGIYDMMYNLQKKEDMFGDYVKLNIVNMLLL